MVNDLQDYVRLTLDEWARSMGAAPSSSRVFLPAVMGAAASNN